MNLISLRQTLLSSLNLRIPASLSFSLTSFSDALVELYWVVSKLKQNAQLCVSESLLEQIITSCKSNDIYWTISPRIWKGIATQSNPSYYHSSIEISNEEPLSPEEKLRQVFISRDEKQVAAYKAIQGTDDNVKLGALLQYPECCVKFFDSYWGPACKLYQGDLTPFVILRSESEKILPFRTNHLTGLFKIPVVSHIPCSFSCEATVRQTEERLMRLSQEKPRLAESLIELMKHPILYSTSMGVALITRWMFIEPERIRCEHAWLTEESYWSEILEVADSVNFNELDRGVLLKGNTRQHLNGRHWLLFWH